MYDEFERAVTGKPKKGIPVFGWILIVVAFLFMFGIVGVGFAAYKTASMVKREFSGQVSGELARELAEVERELAVELRGIDGEIATEIAAALREARSELEANFGDEAPAYATHLLSRMGSDLNEVLENPAMGLAILQDLGSSDHPENALRDVLEGSLRIRTGDGQVGADLWSGEDGGSLVIQGTDGEKLTLDLVRADEGGALIIRSPEGTMRLGAGSEAAGLPDWVATMDRIPDDPIPLFSMQSDDGALGAVSWTTVDAPEAVMGAYRESLSADGYRIRQDYSSRSNGEVDMGFWAENRETDRVVFLSASREDGMTRILLGYGEEVR